MRTQQTVLGWRVTSGSSSHGATEFSVVGVELEGAEGVVATEVEGRSFFSEHER